MQAGQVAVDRSSSHELSKKDYQRLRAQLRFDRSLLPTLAILAFDAALLFAATALLRRGDLPSYLVSQVLLAIVFFNAFAVLHECGHGTASSRPWVNTLIGHLTSLFCLIPYYPWKYIHQQHHAWTGSIDDDPVLKSLRRWRDAGVPWVVRAAWRTWIPLGALLQHGVYLLYPLVMWREGQLTREKLLRTLVSIMWVLSGWLLLAQIAPELARPGNIVLAALLFLIAEELVNIPHHVDMSTFHQRLPVWQQYRATRSCYYPKGVSELLVLNFNLHTEHHLFPDLPWYRLRDARSVLKEALDSRYQEAVGIDWNLANRRRDLQNIVDAYERTPVRGSLVRP